MPYLKTLAASLLLLGTSARAEDVITCVDTVAEFEAAGLAASVDLPNVTRRLIRLEQGAYDLSSADFIRTTAPTPDRATSLATSTRADSSRRPACSSARTRPATLW